MFEPAAEACLRARFSARSQAARPFHLITVPREVLPGLFCAMAGEGAVDFDADDFSIFPPLVQVTAACVLASDVDDNAINEALTGALHSPAKTPALGALVAVRASALNTSRFSEISRSLSASLYDAAALFQSVRPAKAMPKGFAWISILTIHAASEIQQQEGRP